MLEPYLKSKPRLRGKPPNGEIATSSRLSMAIRWFAGGDPLDIFQVHGVGVNEVMTSVWKVVDAINQCTNLQIRFPEDHGEQNRIALAFQRKSEVGYSNCVGCVDGMLVWISKPDKRSVKRARIGPAKYFCGRKKKFGLSLQGICDDRRRFIDIEIRHPGSTSDYLCFTLSSIHQKMLHNSNFLSPGLTLYGDNAYVNTTFMVTPFKGSREGVQDAFNFYHSQLRINIECAFGMLVHRWGVLRKPIPVNIEVQKTVQLVRALCMLHNFCIDNGKQEGNSVASSARDDLFGMNAGGFIQQRRPDRRPEPLIDGGDHDDDFNRRNEVRRMDRQGTLLELVYPRETMLEKLIDLGISSRPAPRGTTTTTSK
jgi:hypothetical protein